MKKEYFRSIGERELLFLINSHNPVYGQGILTNYVGCGCKNSEYGMVSFFTEPLKWKDSQHLFNIKVALSDDKVEFGTAVYMASTEFEKTGVFTGRTGKTRYEINEAYARYYSPEDIIEIDIGYKYTVTCVEKVIKPFCQKYNINLKYINGYQYDEHTGKNKPNYVLVDNCGTTKLNTNY